MGFPHPALQGSESLPACLPVPTGRQPGLTALVHYRAPPPFVLQAQAVFPVSTELQWAAFHLTGQQPALRGTGITPPPAWQYVCVCVCVFDLIQQPGHRLKSFTPVKLNQLINLHYAIEIP